jgi:hypothetical protein
MVVGDTRRGIWERYEREQMVVETKHHGTVVELLEDIGLAPAREQEEIPALSLVLLTVDGLEAAELKGRLREPLPPGEAGEPRKEEYYDELCGDLRARRKQLELPGAPSNLDILLEHLRRTARVRYAGWTPTMGKNRDTEAIEGLPHWGGGDDRPEPASGFSIGARPSTPGRAFRVGILDSRLYPNPQLDGRYVSSDVLDSRKSYRAWEGHAAFIAGRILQRAPGADLDVRAVLSKDGRASSWQVAEQMASFLGSGLDVLNLSLGCPTADGEPPLLLQRAADVLSGETVLVAAAGNHGAQPRLELGESVDAPEILATVPRGPNSPMYPAALPNVVAVGASTGAESPDERATFTPKVPWLDLLAPGVGIPSTFVEGEVEIVVVEQERGRLVARAPRSLGRFTGGATWNGTSFAAADVTGAMIALATEQGWTVREALQALLRRVAVDRSVELPDDIRPAR